MTDIILFHHVQGLTDGVRRFADELRVAGYEVSTPDLFEGRTFDSIDAGLAHVEKTGFSEVLGMAEAAAGDNPDVVYGGFSLGALVSHKLAQTRPGAAGALLYHHGDVAMTTFGKTWPTGVDFQIHVNQGDPFCELEVVQAFVEEARPNATGELYLYPGDVHLFVDSSLPDYEAASASLVMQRTLDFLERLG